ncbi:MAG: acyl-CoA dehydrogenase, partial [Candidatus Marinimicrobia bacterium]|nr:acyl-CoA dehydrogenase [Candidatus Neomarinimicrobiota bacterium]
MNVREKLQLNSGGQWLVSSVATKQIFCRETFTEEHKEIKKMVFEFTENKIYPNIEKIDKLDQNLSKSIIREMGSLGLIGIDTPEKYGGTELDKITSCIVAEGVGWGGSASFGCTFGVQTGIGSLGIVFFGTPEQ